MVLRAFSRLFRSQNCPLKYMAKAIKQKVRPRVIAARPGGAMTRLSGPTISVCAMGGIHGVGRVAGLAGLGSAVGFPFRTGRFTEQPNCRVQSVEQLVLV